MAIRLRTGIGVLAGALVAATLLLLVAGAMAPTAMPAPEGIVQAIFRGSTDAASWLTGLAVEYAGSPLWTTLAGIAIIVLIVSLIMWLRRPRKPTETHVPL